MGKKLFLWLFFGAVIFLGLSAFLKDGDCADSDNEQRAGMSAYATDKEEDDAYHVTRSLKTVEGLNFKVEDDRPIVKVAGVYRPIDIDSYVALKFSKCDKKIDDVSAVLSKRLEDLSEKVESLTRKFEDSTKKVDHLTKKVQELSEAKNESVAMNQTSPGSVP